MLGSESPRSFRDPGLGELTRNARAGSLLWRGLALAAVLAVATGCGPTQNDVEQVSSNQFAMRGLIANDRQEIDALKQQVSQLQDQVDELRRGGGGAPGAGGKSQMAALNERVSKLESEVSPLQGGAPGAPSGTPGTPTAPAPGASLLPGAGAASPGGAPGGTPPPEFAAGTPPATNPPAEAAGGEEEGAPETPASAEGPDWRSSIDKEIAAAQSSSDSGAALYLKGLQEMKAGQYQNAAGRFGTLMRRFPKSALSEPAEYFSGNAFYEMNKYDQAILQFNDLAMRFPKGRFTCAALLREGQAFMQINDRIDARLTLQKLVNDHSDCPESSVASSMMKNLAND